MTGWMSTLSWQAGTASGSFLTGTIIQALITVNNPDYSPTNWQGTLLVFAMVLVLFVANIWGAKNLPLAQNLLLVVHIFGFFAVIIVLWVLAPRNTAEIVFTQFTNEGGWSTMGLSLMVGQISAIYGSICNVSPALPSYSARHILTNLHRRLRRNCPHGRRSQRRGPQRPQRNVLVVRAQRHPRPRAGNNLPLRPHGRRRRDQRPNLLPLHLGLPPSRVNGRHQRTHHPDPGPGDRLEHQLQRIDVAADVRVRARQRPALPRVDRRRAPHPPHPRERRRPHLHHLLPAGADQHRLERRLQRLHLAAGVRTDVQLHGVHLVRAIPADVPSRTAPAGALVTGQDGRAGERVRRGVLAVCLLLVVLAERDAGGRDDFQLGGCVVYGDDGVMRHWILGAGTEDLYWAGCYC
jgi:hypothetical protein